MTVGALILAAGFGRRMPGAHKLTAELNKKPVIAYVADAVAAAELPAIVVVGDRAEAVRAALGGREMLFVEASDFAAGLSASLRAGLAAVPADWDAVIVCLGDMPRVTSATLRAIAAAGGLDAVVIPTWQGSRGNPLLWGRDHFGALATITGDTGGKALLDRVTVTTVEADSDGVLIDIDTPAALAAVRGDLAAGR